MIQPRDFVHLHVHSEYSLLDGASRIKDIINRVKELGMDSAAVTDHGNMYAAVKFYFAAKEAGIHPIVGCEAYLAPRSRFDKETKQDRSPYHLTLIAKDEAGYKNLLSLVTLSNTEGFYQKPRIDKELLNKFGKGLIVMSGCLAGEIPSLILSGEDQKAQETAKEFKEMFGGDFYLEIMDNNIPEQKLVTNRILEISKKYDIPPVATNDSHYTQRHDARAQDVLMCIQTGKFVDEEKRMKFQTEEFYLKSAQEMHALFSGREDALKNTRQIKEKISLAIKTGSLHFPEFPVPIDYTPFSYLKYLTEIGIKKRYGGDISEEISGRVSYELSVIDKMGYSPFFLIVQDFINFAKQQGIEVGPGRGSAAGSIVSYAIGITEVDPLKYNLLFERFLNLERVTMPDIDTDFCYQRRQEVIDYVMKKYGVDHVAQIITFGTMAARAAIRDVGRVLRVPLSDVDRIAKMVPVGPDSSIDNAMRGVKEFKAAYESEEMIKNMIDTAKTLEGLTRHASVHAAGVVISQKPLSEYVPLQIMNENQTVTQYSMKDLEKIGLLKMDFLGLRNLTMIAQAVELIKKMRGLPIDVGILPLDDKKTYELLCRGETIGVFQLESQGMRALMKNLKPDRFEEVIALLALYRPGPLESGMVDDFIKRKNGLTQVTYELKELEPLLKETHGVILYQEQVMQIASEIAGFTLGEADVLRHAMGKKSSREFTRQRDKFMKGALQKGFSEKKAKDLFDLCEKFAGYGFNKSHSTAYAIISYQTAYLKANYPVEFMAALLTSVVGDSDKISFYIAEAHRMGISVLAPDVNESLKDFASAKNSIRFGLAAVKNVGYGAIDSIIASRGDNGPYKSFEDFCLRIDSKAVNKKVIESLIKCGAFDSFKTGRAFLLSKYEEIISRMNKGGAQKHKGQTNLFGEKENSSDNFSRDLSEEQIPELSKEQILRMEKEMLGLYISDHPLHHLKEQLELASCSRISDVLEKKPGIKVAIGGILANARKITTRKKDLMLIGQMEDLTSSISVVFFTNVYEKYSFLLTADMPIVVRGRLDLRNDDLQIICDEVDPLEKIKAKRSIHIEIKQHIDPEALARIRTILAMFRGDEPTMLHIGGKIISASENFRTTISPALIEQIESITGEGSTWIDFLEEETAEEKQ